MSLVNLDIGSMFSGVTGLISEFVEDKDKRNEIMLALKEAEGKLAITLIQQKTTPWVDALVKLMYATKELYRPLVGGAMTAFAGYCVVKARLMDKNGAEIMWAENIDNLEADSPKMIHLDFDGNVILNHGVDGPYNLRDVYIYHTGDPFQPSYVNDAYTCQTNPPAKTVLIKNKELRFSGNS